MLRVAHIFSCYYCSLASGASQSLANKRIFVSGNISDFGESSCMIRASCKPEMQSEMRRMLLRKVFFRAYLIFPRGIEYFAIYWQPGVKIIIMEPLQTKKDLQGAPRARVPLQLMSGGGGGPLIDVDASFQWAVQPFLTSPVHIHN